MMQSECSEIPARMIVEDDQGIAASPRLVDLKRILQSLAAKQPLFTSERDLQFALAWHMKTQGFDLHLEYEPCCFDKNTAIDLLVTHPETVAIELKYITAALTNGSITVRAHPADVARYGVVVDVRRLETVVAARRATRGASILITNNRRLWSMDDDQPLNCDQFRLHEGRTLSGAMSWAEAAGADTFRRYPVPVMLSGAYACRWFDFADLGGRNGLFRCLLIEVSSLPT